MTRNEFYLEGVVRAIEPKQSKKGTVFHIAEVAAGGEVIPITVFGPPPVVGDDITVTGTLSGWNGYPRLHTKSVDFRSPQPVAVSAADYSEPTEDPDPPHIFDEGLPW